MKLIVLLIIFIFNSNSKAQIDGEDIRGKVVIYENSNVNFSPLQFASIVLWQKSPQNKWTVIKETTTNSYGLYFLNNITPGTYYIQVNGMKNYLINVLLDDKPAGTWQDIPLLYF